MSYLRLLFPKLLVEECYDVREAILVPGDLDGWMETTAIQQVLLQWYAVLMTPLGLPLDGSTFYDAAAGAEDGGPSERHYVDKNMLMQDLSLVLVEVVTKRDLPPHH